MITFKTFVDGSQLTTSAATYYTAGTNITAIIKAMTLTNTSASSATVTVHIVTTGAAETDANMIIKAKNLAAGESYTCPEAVNHVIDQTGTIRALASAGSAISLKVSGVEVSQ